MATTKSAGASGYNIQAAVSMHPCEELGLTGAKVDVPILYTAGSTDSVCEDGCAYTQYTQVPSTHLKTFFDIAGISHFDPTNTGKGSELEAISLFFQCHILQQNC